MIFRDFEARKLGKGAPNQKSGSVTFFLWVLRHLSNFLDRNGYWAEWQDPGTIYIFKHNYAKGGLIRNQSEKHLLQVLIGLGMKSKSIYDKNKPYFDEEDRELLSKPLPNMFK